MDVSAATIAAAATTETGLRLLGAGLAAGDFHLSRSNYVSVAREARASIAERGPRIEVVAAAKGPDKRTITLLADVRSNAVAFFPPPSPKGKRRGRPRLSCRPGI